MSLPVDIYVTDLIPTVISMIDGETDYVANCANVAAVLYDGLKKVLCVQAEQLQFIISTLFNCT